MSLKNFQSTVELKKWKVEEWKTQFDDDNDLQNLFKGLKSYQRRIFYKTIVLNPYIPIVPFYKQVAFLTSQHQHREGFYGGARGGGKTELFLTGASQYASFPQWKALILRLTFPQLNKPGAILKRAEKWYTKPYLINEKLQPKADGKNHIYTFPSGSEVAFGHVQHDIDVENYQGAEVHRVLLEEAGQFSIRKITDLYGSVRKLEDDVLPVNVWMNGNPGGLSHDYLKEEFVEGTGLFIDSKLTDNTKLDQEEYKANLKRIAKNDPIRYRQWRYGDWGAVLEGAMFKREWFSKSTYSSIPERVIKRVRFWDMAATLEEDPNKQGGADWSVGALLGLGESGKAYLEDMLRFRKDPDLTEELILSTADTDSRKIILRVEQEGGAQAKTYVHNTLARQLPGYDFEGKSSRKNKIERAKAMLSFIKTGNLKIKEDITWNTAFLNEICSFPTKGVHDDQVDALSGAFAVLFDLDDNSRVDNTDYNYLNQLMNY